ncbi:RNA-binding domain-containing protein [Thiocystis violacea]|uniref:RNA-binding domain-containing protein n=1 Tax=Thiocystis violacea TaxID=13725 RepID=UPI00190311E4|nr:RNA-binding domain-containing protein [Thiocystis violacea]MBK1724965.1 AAA family ATPase [Thiocystis violacea]
MTEPWNSLDLVGLAEAYDLECKAAQGRDGRGELPEDVWKSYSAMANADGGVILLGVREKPRGTFHALGLADVERVRKALWDNLHNRKQVSVNLLAEQDIAPILVDGKTVLRVRVPRAMRQVKPVHLGSNPFGGTYLRRYEGDYAADDETVRRLLAERVEDSRDERVLKGFDFSDLDMDSVAAYRNRFAAVKPGHVWTDLPQPEFLARIGAVGRNREEGYSGLRLAGLLMFGRAEVIRDALPHYMVDYQERPEAKAEKRWIDRLVPDGSWSGNVYDFFRKVYQKLTVDLKVPFQLQEGQRVDDTPVHEALREALVNTLIHADYSGRVSVLVVKRPDMFGFRNPGRMRIPPELAIQGGNSDCRNRRLQTMFQLVGYGDHAGSGLPKIYTNWAGRHWRRPVLYELPEPEQTLMELRMSSLVPEEAITELEAHLGSRFHALPETGRLALITSQVEGQISHDRLKQMSADHPADLTKLLGSLVRDGLLVSEGSGRGTVYYLPWRRGMLATVFDLADQATVPPELGSIPPEFGAIPPELAGQAPEVSSYLDWAEVPTELQGILTEQARPVSETRRAKPEDLRVVVRQLCAGRYLGRHVLAHLLQRNADDLLKRTLSPMVEAGQLKPAYAASRDPRQAYIASPSPVDEHRQ